MLGDDVADAARRLVEHAVGKLEDRGHAAIGDVDLHQPLVGDHQQGIDLLAQRGQPGFGLGHAPTALERERAGDDGDRQGAARPGGRRHQRRGARPGAAAHAGRHEDHVGVLDEGGEQFLVLFGGLPADLGVATGPEAAGQAAADHHGLVGLGRFECLAVGVDGEEVDLGEAFFDHAIDRIATGAADADDLDLDATIRFRGSEMDIHDTRLLREMGSC